MIAVDEFEARIRLSSLLEEVAQGEEVLITRRGKAVAQLVRVEKSNRSEIKALIDELRLRRKGVTLGGLDWRTLRDEGRIRF